MRAPGRVVLLLSVAIMALSCGRDSEEARIRRFLERTAARAEKGDVAAVSAALAEDYRDFEGRDKAAAKALIAAYLKRSGIVIHLLGVQVETEGASGRASVKAEVLLSSGAAEVFRRLVRYAGECYRFGLELEKTPAGGWLVASAAWESVSLADLLPESAAILKKLFPGR